MKNIYLGFAQRVEEFEFLKSNLSIDSKKLVMVPLNLETLLHYKINNINHENLLKLLDNEIHNEALDEFEKIKLIIEANLKNEDYLVERYIGIIRKYFNSIFLIIKILEKLEDTYEIKKIFLSGWDTYDFSDIKKNFFISRIITSLYSKKYKIEMVENLETKFIENNFSILIPKKINFNYIYLNNLGYNFKYILIKNFFGKRRKIFTLDDSNISNIKKFFFRLLLVRFLKKENRKTIKNSNLELPKIKYKFDGLDLSELFEFKNSHIESELSQLKNLKKDFLQIFKIKKPEKFFLNNARGINSFISKYAKENNISCFLISHGTLSLQKNRYGKIYNDIIAEEVTSEYAKNCSQSQLSNLYFEENFEKDNVVKTGNLIFSQGKPNTKNYFLYAVTSRDFANTHYYGIETFYEFYDNLEFLDKFVKESKIKILVKLHPGVMYLRSEFSKIFNNLIFCDENIKKLLKKSIALISYSSSTIEDALGLNVPIILLDRWNRYNHLSEIELNKKNKIGYYVKNHKEFREIINDETFLKNKQKISNYRKSPLQNFQNLLNN